MMRVLRHEVPVDDEIHSISCGRIVHIATRRPEVVEMWAMDDGDGEQRQFIVLGTGHSGHDDWEYVGTAIVPNIPLVWHLFEVSNRG